MVDIFSKAKRSEIMKKVGPKNSKPELFIRSLVHSLGYRFRLHRKDLPGTPDLVFQKYKKVIFINGCFWHGHKDCRKSRLPETNKEFWENKISKNIKNDQKVRKKLLELGWENMTIWECEVKKKNIDDLTQRIIEFLKL